MADAEGMGGGVTADFRFDNETVRQADGLYEECVRIMADDAPVTEQWAALRAPRTPHRWFLVTNLLLVHTFGISQMRLELHWDGSVVIQSFSPSDPDPLMNYDVRSLRAWAYANGWKRPRPGPHVVSERLSFWRHMWQCEAVDSPDLERRFGPRRVADDATSEGGDE